MEPTSKRWRGCLMVPVLLVAVFSIVVTLSFIAFSSPAGKGKLVRIDTHAHFLPAFYSELLASKGIRPGGRPIPQWNAADHLAFMDSLDIELSVLSVSTPGARLTPSDVDGGRKLARQLNEYGHMLSLAHPERFQFFATLTLPDVEGAVEEAIYCLDTLKAAGVTLFANSHGEYLGNPKLDPLMEVLNAREATAFIHPSELDIAPVTNDVGGDRQVTMDSCVIDFLLDTTRAAQNLVAMKVMKRYPKIKFILAHSGGFLPFAAYRMAGPMSHLLGESPQKCLEEFQKFYVDTALSSSPSALPSTLAIIPHNHITFGSDFPFVPTFGIKAGVSNLDRYFRNHKSRDSVNFQSASALLKTPLSHWRSIWHQEAGIMEH